MGRFVRYDYAKNKSFRPPVITLTKNGAINFNAGMLQKHINKKVYVILYYDKVGNRIGFEFLADKSTKAFKIRTSPDYNFGTIAGRAFLNYNDIPHEETNRYSVDIDNETKYIVINLKKPIKSKDDNKQIDEEDETRPI